MTGREDKKSNDLFFACSLIEYIARKTNNTPAFIASELGKTRIERIIDLADIYHSDNIDDVADAFIDECGIMNGDFDNVSSCRFSVPSHWDIGKVYKRLILSVADEKSEKTVDALVEVFASRIVDLIEDYNSSFYYENPSYIFETYINDCDPSKVA